MSIIQHELTLTLTGPIYVTHESGHGPIWCVHFNRIYSVLLRLWMCKKKSGGSRSEDIHHYINTVTDGRQDQ